MSEAQAIIELEKRKAEYSVSDEELDEIISLIPDNCREYYQSTEEAILDYFEIYISITRK